MVAQSSAVQPFDSGTNVRRDILDVLYNACWWDAGAKKWYPPSVETPFQVDEDYWRQLLKADYPATQGSAAQPGLESVSARFFEDEPDANRDDRPRLDIVLTYTDGRWVRYHPKAILIWSDDFLPTPAMRIRYNRAAKLAKRSIRGASEPRC